jgi:hypothetical protein
MNSLPSDYIFYFEETITKYLLFLVHIQQSIKISINEKIKLFDYAKDVSNSIYSNIQSYISNKNQYNDYDKNEILIKSFDNIKKEIESDLQNYKRKITIADFYFSYYNIIDTLTETNNTVYLTENNIKQMLSYKDLLKSTEQGKLATKQLESLQKKQEIDFVELRKKTFQDMLHGNKNKKSMRFFEVNEYILNNYKKEDIKYIHSKTISLKEGLYFIETQDERTITLILDKRIIEYTIQVIDMEDCFIMYIQGYIKINESKDDFYINEKYLNSQFSKVLNAYNLKRLLDLFGTRKFLMQL